jgi:hypothetical protein
VILNLESKEKSESDHLKMKLFSCTPVHETLLIQFRIRTKPESLFWVTRLYVSKPLLSLILICGHYTLPPLFRNPKVLVLFMCPGGCERLCVSSFSAKLKYPSPSPCSLSIGLVTSCFFVFARP